MHDVIFQQVNHHLRDDIHWHPFEQCGTSNYIYHGMRYDMPLILRVNGEDERTFGVDRVREASVLKAIQPFSWAMQVLCCDASAGWCVMKNHGEPVSHDQMRRHHDQLKAGLLSVAADFQLLTTPAKFSYPDLFESYQKQLNQLPDPCYWLHRLDQMISLFRYLPRVPSCLVHHDLHKGNILIDDEAPLNFKIIDWEYAGVGNPWLDIAMLHTEFDIAASELSTLPVFSRLSDDEFSVGLQDAVRFNQLLTKLWYQIRGAA